MTSKVMVLCAFLAFIGCVELLGWLVPSSDVCKSSTGTKDEKRSISSVEETKVLIAVPAYGENSILYVEELIDSFRDMCEAGLDVSLLLYKTSAFPVEVENVLSSRMHCIRGSFETKVIVKPITSGFSFVTFHRQYFFDHAQEYDLFIYAEDDMLVRLRHVVAYLHETARVKELVDNFFDYSLGFVRYEQHLIKKTRTVFEFWSPNWTKVEGLDGRYFSSPPPHHQAMFMATREQLLYWKDSCECFRNMSVAPRGDFYRPEWNLFRERVSSLCLFVDCQVTQLLPIDTFEDFMIHHLPNKYWNMSYWESRGKTDLEMQRIRKRFNDTKVNSTNGNINTIISP